MLILYEGLHGNLVNIAASALNRHAEICTKHLINEYIQEICVSLDFIH